MDDRQDLSHCDSKKKCDLLGQYILDFKSKHPNLSSNQIAQKLSIPQATLNRIENGTTNPSLENVLNVLVGTGNGSKVAETIGTLFPNHKERFEKIFSANLETPLIDEIASRFATDPDTFLLVQLGFTRSGVSEKEVRERFGSFGVEKLKALIASDVLVGREDGTYAANEEKVNVTFKDLKKIVCLAVEKCFDPHLIEEGHSHLSYQTESVSDEGLSLILAEVKKAQVAIKRIMYNPNYYGENKVFVSMVADLILKNDSGVKQ